MRLASDASVVLVTPPLVFEGGVDDGDGVFNDELSAIIFWFSFYRFKRFPNTPLHGCVHLIEAEVGGGGFYVKSLGIIS